MRGGQEGPEAEMLPQARGMMVWRRGYVASLRALDALEYDALMFASGSGSDAGTVSDGSFGALCGMLVARLGETDGVAKAASFLANWIGSELITGLGTEGASHA